MPPTLNPLVSVVLPFYNAECTLNRAIQSIAEQTFINFECLLVNNNSTDKSVEIAHNWCAKDNRFKLISETRQGVVYAFNKGADIAKGNFIARMDADDYCFPNKLELQVELLAAKPHIQVVSGLVEYIPYKNNTEGFKHYVNWVNSVVTYNEIILRQFIESPIVNPTAMWRKGVGEQYGLYKEGNFPEDYEMYLRWLQQGVQIEKVDKYVLKWFDSEQRLTRTKAIYSNDAFYRIKSNYLNEWLQNNNPFYPKVVVWGASKLSRNHASYIENHGIEIEFYIDVKKDRQITEKVMYYKDLPKAGKYFILVYLKHNTLREKIGEFLLKHRYKEGVNFLYVS